MSAIRKKQGRARAAAPLYIQVAEKIRYQITTGYYKAEMQLPSEADLTRMFNVSRVTIRQSLANLEDEGYIFKRQGLGSFVSDTRVMQNFSGGAQTIVEALRQQGIEASIRTISLEHMLPDDEVKQALRTDQEVVCLTRVFSNGCIPVAQSSLYLPISIGGVAYILAKDAAKQTTYTVLEQSLGFNIKGARHVIHTVALDERTSVNLQMHVGDICLGMSRTTYSAQGVPLEFTRLIYPPNTMRLEVLLPRAAEAPVLTMFSRAAE